MKRIESDLDLDSPERTEEHREIISSNRYLNRLYRIWYQQFYEVAKTLPTGQLLELGSGGGFIQEIIPEVITSDVLHLSRIDKVIDARLLPFPNDSLSGIFMINVLHHVPQVERFFAEASRTLVTGGKIVMIEPASTPVSRFIYKNHHHELFDESLDWSFPQSGPLSGSNQALPSIIFNRDLEKFHRQFSSLGLSSTTNHTPLSYVISGGLSRSPILPSQFFDFIYFLEKYPLRPFMNLLALFQTITVVEK